MSIITCRQKDYNWFNRCWHSTGVDGRGSDTNCI